MSDVLNELAVFSTPFHARAAEVRDPKGSSHEAEADILTAVFDVEDNNPAVGNMETQVIDKGAFRTAIAEGPLNPTHGLRGGRRQFLQDHGHAMIHGFVDSDYILGFADNWQEVDDGLIHTGHFNLRTTRGQEMYEKVKFAPDILQSSFRWPPNEKIQLRSGRAHVTEFTDVMESSIVGMGANFATGVVAVRTAIEQLVAQKLESDDGFRSGVPKAEDLKAWAASEDFRSMLTQFIAEDEALRSSVSEALNVALDEYAMKVALAADTELARSIRTHIDELLKPPPPDARGAWYGAMFEHAAARR